MSRVCVAGSSRSASTTLFITLIMPAISTRIKHRAARCASICARRDWAANYRHLVTAVLAGVCRGCSLHTHSFLTIAHFAPQTDMFCHAYEHPHIYAHGHKPSRLPCLHITRGRPRACAAYARTHCDSASNTFRTLRLQGRAARSEHSLSILLLFMRLPTRTRTPHTRGPTQHTRRHTAARYRLRRALPHAHRTGAHCRCSPQTPRCLWVDGGSPRRLPPFTARIFAAQHVWARSLARTHTALTTPPYLLLLRACARSGRTSSSCALTTSALPLVILPSGSSLRAATRTCVAVDRSRRELLFTPDVGLPGYGQRLLRRDNVW